ncbi:MAG: hypothetical protein KU29_08190 [Sulfurovum sp. FS06-10]|nr:MAG: hypothetical protein KU29_08190 [Sulfurovum sp. FS06-10]
MKNLSLLLSTMALVLLSTGCTPVTSKYRIQVDAITKTNQNIAPSSYSVKPLNSNIDANDLKFQRDSQELIKILNQQGFTPATYSSLAQQVIYFDYGIQKVKERTRTYVEPDVRVGFSWGFPYGGYYGHPYSPFWGYYGYGGGYSSVYRKTYIYYNRYITLLAKEQSGRDLWRVDVSSVGESRNLQKILPLLLEAAKPYIGTNTAEPIEVILKEKSDRKE